MMGTYYFPLLINNETCSLVFRSCLWLRCCKQRKSEYKSQRKRVIHANKVLSCWENRWLWMQPERLPPLSPDIRFKKRWNAAEEQARFQGGTDALWVHERAAGHTSAFGGGRVKLRATRSSCLTTKMQALCDSKESENRNQLIVIILTTTFFFGFSLCTPASLKKNHNLSAGFLQRMLPCWWY